MRHNLFSGVESAGGVVILTLMVGKAMSSYNGVAYMKELETSILKKFNDNTGAKNYPMQDAGRKLSDNRKVVVDHTTLDWDIVNFRWMEQDVLNKGHAGMSSGNHHTHSIIYLTDILETQDGYGCY